MMRCVNGENFTEHVLLRGWSMTAFHSKAADHPRTDTDTL